MKAKFEYVVFFGYDRGTLMYSSFYYGLPTDESIQLNKQELIDSLPELRLDINDMFHVIIPYSMIKGAYKKMKWKHKVVLND